MTDIIWVLSKLEWANLVDILLVAVVIYLVLQLVRGTQAVQLIRGAILVALALTIIGSIARLTAFSWLLRNAGQALLIIVAVVLQPELRRVLDRLGRAGGLTYWATTGSGVDHTARAIASACAHLSGVHHGALIVIERETGLQDYIDTGVLINSAVNSELLQTIFFPNTALHDGAVIIRGNQIIAAACLLPLSEAVAAESHLGTRHRAAIGITEASDAIAIVVSEETGIISIAHNGRMVRHLDERRLVTLMLSLLKPDQPNKTGLAVFWERIKDRFGPQTPTGQGKS
ncbi:MAG: TIGR00159 family protein [Chloroflexi bacterium]|nr:TIGR00159 family protein [Chloroflexota bacterium]